MKMTERPQTLSTLDNSHSHDSKSKTSESSIVPKAINQSYFEFQLVFASAFYCDSFSKRSGTTESDCRDRNCGPAGDSVNQAQQDLVDVRGVSYRLVQQAFGWSGSTQIWNAATVHDRRRPTVVQGAGRYVTIFQPIL